MSGQSPHFDLFKRLWLETRIPASVLATMLGYKNANVVWTRASQLGFGRRHGRGWRKPPPDFNPNEKIEDLGAHFAECHKLKVAL